MINLSVYRNQTFTEDIKVHGRRWGSFIWYESIVCTPVGLYLASALVSRAGVRGAGCVGGCLLDLAGGVGFVFVQGCYLTRPDLVVMQGCWWLVIPIHWHDL